MPKPPGLTLFSRYYRGDVKIPVKAYKKWFVGGSSANLDRADQVLQDTLTSVNVSLPLVFRRATISQCGLEHICVFIECVLSSCSWGATHQGFAHLLLTLR